MTDPRVPLHPHNVPLHELRTKSDDMVELHETSIETIAASSLMVTVDYLELVESVGESEAWVVLGKLKDLLG